MTIGLKNKPGGTKKRLSAPIYDGRKARFGLSNSDRKKLQAKISKKKKY